jgi:hypothetical protein
MAFRKPKDYDNVKVGSDFRVLPADGYICTILKAEETESRNGRPMLKVAFDIAEGDYKGYFKDQFDSKKANADEPNSVKWPFSGTKWILFLNNEGETNRDFKSFCTALEDSGTKVWINDTFDANGLKGAKIGIIFRREEHEYQNATSWRTVPWGFRSVETIEKGTFNVPEDKALPGSISGTGFAEVDTFSAAEDEIPF